MPVTIDGYDMLDPVGSGGYSRVYRARQLAFDRVVALKVLDCGFETEAQRRRFERECRVMGLLGEHPNIVTVFDTALTGDGRGCIVMEYYGGGTLGERLATGGAIGVEELLPIGVQIAGALETAHRRGVIHRDLKPHNLFLSDYGQPALGDFGISSLVDDRTVTGGGGGLTVHYAPPEVIEGGVGSEAGDVYSMAATLYTLLSGSRPFPRAENQSVADLARRILFEPAPRLDAGVGPESLADLIQIAMSKEPVDRPPSAEALGLALQDIQRAQGWVVTPLPVLKGSGEAVATGESGRRGRAEAVDATPRAVPHIDFPPVGAGAVEVSGFDRAEAIEEEMTAVTRPRPIEAAPGPEEMPAVATATSRHLLPWLLTAFGVAAVVALVVAAVVGDQRSPVVGISTTAPTTDTYFSTPARPTGVTMRMVSGRVEVAWEQVDGADAYQVRRVDRSEPATEVGDPVAWFDPGEVTCVEVVAVGVSGHLSPPSRVACRTNDNSTE